ncbi:MAG: deoxyribodipyrimidine photo-lyase [Burkholderiaceae bacterium]
MTSPETQLVWLRRDLRLADNAAICSALAAAQRLQPAFVFDTEILDALPDPADRVEFIWHALAELDLNFGAGRLVDRQARSGPRTGPADRQRGRRPRVHAAADYEPAAIERDDVGRQLAGQDTALVLVRDHALTEPGSLLTQAGKPYTVFTPYLRRWNEQIGQNGFDTLACPLQERLLPGSPAPMPTLQSLGFVPTNLTGLPIALGESGGAQQLAEFAGRIGQYQALRNFPAAVGPSYLSVHLRFGTVSIRQAAQMAWQTLQADRAAAEGARTWLNELAWRDFYFHILQQFPEVCTQAFRADMRAVRWEDDDAAFAAWCAGRTGYPLVDAAMAQINRTGYMHNRLRMVVASFLTKDLGIHWQRGERYFADKLNDFDLSANNGGWQWAASTGCDAQPYFRIFNPVSQSEKFDPRGRFIRRYLPQLAALSDKEIHAPWKVDTARLAACGITLGRHYPRPIVDHASARKRTLARFGAGAS